MESNKDVLGIRYQGRLALLGFILFVCTACAVPLLDQALEGKLDSQMSNEVVASYCQSCHVHKNVTEKYCLDEKPSLYDRSPYNSAVECRVCHFMEKEFWRSSREARHTRRPEDVKENKYVDFEEEFLEERRENHVEEKEKEQEDGETS